MNRQEAEMKDIVQKYFTRKESGQDGYVLILCLVVLLLLTILGISSTMLTTVELQIAGNDRTHKETFYEADGGVETSTVLIEENISCPLGFHQVIDDNDPATFYRIGGVEVADTRFIYDVGVEDVANSLTPGEITSIKDKIDVGTPASEISPDFPSDNIRSARIPLNPASANKDSEERTNIAVLSETGFVPGGATEMAAASEGPGKTGAGGGIAISYDVYSQRVGRNNSETILKVEWMHLIGSEGECNY